MVKPNVSNRPHTVVVLAMSADGKIADAWRSPARFGSAADRAHLEQQIAQSDAMLFGGATLRAYGTTLRVTDPTLLQQRQQQGKPAQPVQVVCSESGHLNPEMPFFRQAVPRWLLTSLAGAEQWRDRPEFEQVLTPFSAEGKLDWQAALQWLFDRGIRQLTVGGGGELVASLLSAGLVDEFWLTVCPLLLGGAQAPTPVGGTGFLPSLAPQLELRSAETVGNEVFLHYIVQRQPT